MMFLGDWRADGDRSHDSETWVFLRMGQSGQFDRYAWGNKHVISRIYVAVIIKSAPRFF